MYEDKDREEMEKNRVGQLQNGSTMGLIVSQDPMEIEVEIAMSHASASSHLGGTDVERDGGAGIESNEKVWESLELPHFMAAES